MEALACGLPCLTAVRATVAELFADVTSTLDCPVEPRQLAQKVSALLRSPQARDDLGVAGRSRLVGEFSWQTFVTRFAEFARLHV
ncbi:MAG TPA: hypothetical protein DCR55_09830 [Lentisphaeria bacterium]|nr:hypothetical protein [Lentisphaeria bacterium]